MKHLPACLKVLAIDDDPANLELVSAALNREEVELYTAGGPREGLRLFAEKRPHLVLVDLMMPEMDGIEVLEEVLALDPGVDVILMTAHYSSESAVQAIRKGAADYLEKPLDLQKLRERVDLLAIELQRRRRAHELDGELVDAYQFQGIVGRSPLMLDLFGTLRRVGRHFRSVLVLGETGTGKELVASALHRLSPVAGRKFAVCNCSAISDTLVESELFGYTRGAFTGATQDKIGLFEFADGGVVFLDEIGEMPLAAQAKLLRVIQNQEIQRVGSPAARKIDVRVIAATHRDLKREVAEKRFREDLFYRLSMVSIEIPPLRKRKEDLPLLQRFLVEKFSEQYGKSIKGVTRRAEALLARYPWPGNVRELENVIGNACMMAEGDVLDVADLPDYLKNPAPAKLDADTELLSLEAVQQRHIARVLESVGGNKARAAEVLQISRSALYASLAKIESEQRASAS